MNRDVRLAAIYKTRSFFGVLRFGLVRWDGDSMMPDHAASAGSATGAS